MKAVILIHGFCTNTKDFDNILPYLEPLYDKVMEYIVPGHQIPPKYSEFKVKTTFSSLVECYDSLALDYDTIDCIGFSMGGALATYLQSVREINRLVLLAPANKYLNFNILASRIKYKVDSFNKLVKTKHVNDVAYKQIERNLESLGEDDRAAIKLAVTELFPHYSPRNLTTFISIINRCNKELIEINPPTLIIWGKLDQFVPRASIDYLESLATNECKVVIRDDLSHLMLRSVKYKEIIEIIVKFLKEEGN